MCWRKKMMGEKEMMNFFSHQMESLEDLKIFTRKLLNDLYDYRQEKHYAVINIIQVVIKASPYSFVICSLSILTFLFLS